MARNSRPSWSWLFEDEALPQRTATALDGVRYLLSLALLAILTVIALVALRPATHAGIKASPDGADAPTYSRSRTAATDWDDWFRPLA